MDYGMFYDKGRLNSCQVVIAEKAQPDSETYPFAPTTTFDGPDVFTVWDGKT
jgi:hypothetical protein